MVSAAILANNDVKPMDELRTTLRGSLRPQETLDPRCDEATARFAGHTSGEKCIEKRKATMSVVNTSISVISIPRHAGLEGLRLENRPPHRFICYWRPSD